MATTAPDKARQLEEAERAEWLAWRRQGLGASDVPKILGKQPSRGSAFSVWCEKRGLITGDQAPGRRQRLGILKEPLLRRLFYEDTGLHVGADQLRLEHPTERWRRATVDGMVFDTHDAAVTADKAGAVIRKLKTPATRQARTRRILEDALGGYEGKTDGTFKPWGTIPEGYQIQALWAVGLTDLDRWWFGVEFAGHNFQTYELHRDQAAIDRIVDYARWFWEECVCGDELPPVDDSPATTDALTKIQPEHIPGQRVDLGALKAKVDEYFELGPQITELTNRRKGLGNEIRAAMGKAEVGLVDGRPVVAYRSYEKAGYTVAPSTQRPLTRATKEDLANAE